MTLQELCQQTLRHFTERFSEKPEWVVAAPGRVNIIGEHTDYNDGFVLPMAIERWTVLAACRIAEPTFTVHSQQLTSTAHIHLTEPVNRGRPDWSNYVRGVIAGFQRFGLAVPGCKALMNSTVPLGSGLSSSAALEVATATLLERTTEHSLDPVRKALLCQRAEHEFAGVPCGIMDQFTSALARQGHLLLLDCRSHAVRLVPMADPAVSVLIINTNVRHELANGEYAQRRAQCETAAKALGVVALRDATRSLLNSHKDQMDPIVFQRAHHVITEIERTHQAAEALSMSSWHRAGDLMYASHASLRDDYQVSCQELDAVVEIAQSIGPEGGVFGCRMTGGGFGGCAVALVQADAVATLAQQITQQYQQRTRRNPTLFVSRPAEGASSLAVT